ncbi:MAG: O-antigen ligase family protein, partial [Defluviitaleaceae bacterium]|nr:O-antigen ligase family protein [Defluviitaleaceae bacterium]
LLVSSLIMGMIGFSQFINRDFFATSIGQWLITPRHLDFVELAVGFDIAYGTNFNPNTFGLVTAMLFPLLLGAALAFPGRVWRGLFLFASLLMIIGVVGSRSVGGFIGAATAVAAIAITLAIRWLVSREKSVFSARGVAILLIGLVVIAGTGFALRQPLYDNLSFTMGRISAIFEPPEVHLPEFTFQENRLTMTDRGVTYHITFPATGVPEVTTADGTPIEHSAERDDEADLIRYTYEVPGFGTVAVQRNEAVYLYRGILMTVEDGLLHMLMFNGDMINPNEPIPSWGFEGWETWGSNRGFIFARTIPLLPQFWLVGNGSDTFGLAFPNHDLISKARYFGSPYIVVDKAHNLYLQTAVTTGWISAFALIGLFGYFMLTSFWSLIKDSQEGVSVFWLRLGILASVSAFAISSLSTDSTVSSTPIFLIILGIGYALNKLSPKRGQGD